MPYKLIKINSNDDSRGSLISLESFKDVPFDIKRIYYLYGCNEQPRGFHAHRELVQFIICVSGSCSIKLTDSHGESTYLLNHPTSGLLISGIVWREMFDFSDDAVLLVLASEFYDENDYIHSYSQFVKESLTYDS